MRANGGWPVYASVWAISFVWWTGTWSMPPFRPTGEAVNYVAGFNVLSIVVELPSSALENGAPGKLNIWGTISR